MSSEITCFELTILLPGSSGAESRQKIVDAITKHYDSWREEYNDPPRGILGQEGDHFRSSKQGTVVTKAVQYTGWSTIGESFIKAGLHDLIQNLERLGFRTGLACYELEPRHSPFERRT